MPPSHRDLDTSVNFVKNLLQNEPSRSRSPSGLDAPTSRLPNRSLHSSSAPGAGGRQDATVYKHTDEEPAGGYYTPRSRHLDRSAVRASSERDSPAADLSDMKRQLENTARMLDRATEESALRTAEDDALDREMSDLKWKVQRVQEDLEYASRGPRSFRADEERRRLERELLQLMHERVPAVEKKLAEREERRARQKRELDRERDRRNETFGRFSDRNRDREYGSSYSRDADGDRYSSGYERDRDRDREYRDDRSLDTDRDRPYRDRSRSWDRKNDRERPRSPPVSARSPPPPPPVSVPVPVVSKSPPAVPTPGKSPAPNVKNMAPEERRAFIQAEAQRRTAERMAAMGLSVPPSSSSPKPTLDTSTEDRLAREKKEAEEKARAAEEAAAERARQRDKRLKSERGEGASTPASTVATAQMAPATVVPKVPPPVKPRAPAPPPPRKPGSGAATRSPAGRLPPKTGPSVTTPPVSKPSAPLPAPAPPAADREEEELRVREEALRKQKEERLARMRRLEEEEKEEEAQRQREGAARLQREQEEAARKAKQERLERLRRMEEEEAEEVRREEEAREARRARTPAPTPVAHPPAPVVPPVPLPPPAPPAIVTSPVDRGKNNPFNRLINSGASQAAPSPQANGGNNPFFRSQPVAHPVALNNDTTPLPPAPTSSIPMPPQVSKSPAPPVVKTSYHTAPGDSEDEWGQEKDEGDDSSEDELNSSRDTRDKLARQLFGSILPPASVPPRPHSAAAGASTTPKASTPTALSAPAPPPPPPPPPPSAPPAPAAPTVPSAPTPAGGRSALLNAIQSGTRLRKAVTDDRSASAISGRVIGDNGPSSHIGASPTILPAAETSHSEKKSVDPSRQSVDWYMGLAADQGTHVSQEPSLFPMSEEDEEQAREEVNGHAVPVPDIRVAHAEGVESDPLADIDRGTGMSLGRPPLLTLTLFVIAEYRVRTLYPYDGLRVEDLCGLSSWPPAHYLLAW